MGQSSVGTHTVSGYLCTDYKSEGRWHVVRSQKLDYNMVGLVVRNMDYIDWDAPADTELGSYAQENSDWNEVVAVGKTGVFGDSQGIKADRGDFAECSVVLDCLYCIVDYVERAD